MYKIYGRCSKSVKYFSVSFFLKYFYLFYIKMFYFKMQLQKKIAKHSVLFKNTSFAVYFVFVKTIYI